MAKRNKPREAEGWFSAGRRRLLRQASSGAEPPLPALREGDINLSPSEKTLLQILFSGYESIVINREFTEGKSPTRVLQATPWKHGMQRADLVIKLGPQPLIESELKRQEEYFQGMLPFSAASLAAPPVYQAGLGAVAYIYIAGSSSLKDYYLEHTAGEILAVLERLFIRGLGQTYYRARHPGNRPFFFDDIYGLYFPPNLTLVAADLSRARLPRQAAYTHFPANSPASTYRQLRPEQLVHLEGFAVEQNLQTRLILKHPEAPLRLRLTVEGGRVDLVPFEPGQTVHLQGQITGQRQDEFRNIVSDIFAGVAPVDPQAETIQLAGHDYPNPLQLYPTYLNQPLPRNLSITHGDLHMDNVLVDSDGKPWLIDPGRATEGHTLFDFIELETHLRHAILGEIDFDLADLIGFERNLMCAALEQPHTPPTHPDLAKAFEVIRAIRALARGYLAQGHTFQSEYCPAQLLYALSTLKHHRSNGARSARHAFVTATLLAAYLQEQFDCQAPLHLTDPALEQHVYYLKKADGDAERQQAERQQIFIAQLQQAADQLSAWLGRPAEQVSWDTGPPPERHTMTRRYYSGKWAKESGQARAWLMAYELNDTYLLRLVVLSPGQAHPPEILAEMRRQLPWQPDAALPEWLGQSFFYTAISQANPTELAQAAFETSSLRRAALTCGELYAQAGRRPGSESAYLLVCASPEQDDLAGDFFDQLAPQLGWYAHKAYRQTEEYESYLRSEANDREQSLSALLTQINALHERLNRGEQDFERPAAFRARLRELEVAVPGYDGLLTRIRNILAVIKINVENYRRLTQANDFLNAPDQDEIFVEELRRLEPLPRQVESDLDLWQNTLDQARRALETLRPVAGRFPPANHDPQQLGADLRAYLQARYPLSHHLKLDLTLMFDDLKDSTDYGDQHGDEQLLQLLQQHNRLLHPIISRHQGQVVKNTGDGTLAIFSDPANAVQAALEIQTELQAHNRQAGPLDQLHIRLGLHSGQALLIRDDVLGRAVNLAARICAEAGAGEVVISEATYRQAGAVAAGFEALEARELKGIEGKVGLYRRGVQG